MSSSATANDPRFPIGKPELHSHLTVEQRKEFLEQIAYLPANLREAVRGLQDGQLDTPYREGGWTVRRVVHHLADSHINSYVRFKLALTEDKPHIKGYDENEWAKLPDNEMPIDVSLSLLDSLHRRWVTLLHSLKPEDFRRTLIHSERGEISLDSLVALYAWHGRHHTAHITELKKARNWK
jgi:uncharacterized damage-inducible protein DinB